MLWPSIAAGLMPHAWRSSASASSTTKSAGCVTSVCRRRSAAAGSRSAPERAPRGDPQPTSARSASQTSSTRARRPRQGVVEPARHLRILRPLAREQKRHRRIGGAHDASRRSSACRAREPRGRFSGAVATTARRLVNGRRPTVSVYAASASDDVGSRREDAASCPAARSSAVVAARRQRQQELAGRVAAARRRRRLLEHDVRVRAADAERADARAPRARFRPVHVAQRGVHVERGWRRSRCPGWARRSAARRQLAVLAAPAPS